MEAGETMVEIMRSTPTPGTPASNVATVSGDTHEGIKQYYIQKIEELQLNVAEKSQNLRRLQAKRNELNAKVRMLREELQLLQEQGSLVGEVVKAMDKKKVLVKVHPEGKFVVDLDKNIDMAKVTPSCRVALKNDSYTLHKILPNKVDPLVSLMMVEKVPDSTYEMVGGLDKQIKEIKEVIELPVKHPELFDALGISQPKGVLLYGPPGTGKTLLARAVAHHTECTFIRVSGSELVQKFIGEGSRMVRELFVMAREHAPSIIFMDEIDSIGSTRVEGSSGGDSEVQRTMLELLNQLDGFEPKQNIKVIMATNRIDILDPALLRPGRIDRKIEFPAPSEEARLDILKIHSRKMNLTRGINLRKIAEMMPGASGAEVKGVCTEAGMYALRERRVHVTQEDFELAVAKIHSSIVFILDKSMELRLSLIRSPNYPDTINVDEDLQDYFSEPRRVKLNEQITIRPLLQPELEVYFLISSVTKEDVLVSCDNCRIIIETKNVRQEKLTLTGSASTDETIVFISQRLCQMFTIFDLQWSKQISIPTILLHGLDDFNSLVDYACRQCGYHCHTVSSQLLTGDSAAATNKRIEQVIQIAGKCTPCVLFFNHVNFLCKLTDVENDDAIVTNGLRRFIQQARSTLINNGPLIILAGVSRLHLLSEQVLSLFSYTLSIPAIPMEIRKQWLRNRLSTISVADDFNYDLVLAQTKGWPLAEIDQLIRLTIEAAYWRSLESVDMPTMLTNADFEIALKQSHASKLTSQRKAMIPNVRWSDIGGLAMAKKEILNTIQLPLIHPDLFGDLARTGILLYGPPGSGKTLLAKAVATEFSLNFLSVRGPELLNMYVGQSEQNVRDLFERARLASPCILFFDELDSLAPRRGRTSSDSSGVSDRLVSQLLTEIDQQQQEHHIFIIGATNRPDLLDDSLLRPGRFDKLIYIGISNDHNDRRQMFQALTQKFKIVEEEFDADAFVRACPLNMTGADFYALASGAYLSAIRRLITNNQEKDDEYDQIVHLIKSDFTDALATFTPSLDENDIRQYERLQKS
ncbi:unnamed protein product [Rotaria magnacalcarata]